MKQRDDRTTLQPTGRSGRLTGSQAARSATPPPRRGAGRPAPAPRSGRRRGRPLLSLLGLAILIAVAVAVVLPALAGGPPGGDPAGRPIAFTVRLGDTVPVVAQRLQDAGVLTSGLSATVFQLDARVRGLGGRLRAGSYTLSTGMGATAALDALGQPPVPLQRATVTVTIPPGLRLEQVAHLLAARKLSDEAQFLDLARHGQFANDFLRGRPPGATLEGYLFPDTYNVLPTVGARGMIQTMLDRFGAEFSLPLRRAVWARGRTLHEAVTLASIVQREAVFAQERPLIAGVYINRIAGHEGGYLNADPTVQYAVGASSVAAQGTWWTRNLTQADLAVDSPYNTYIHRGLPPGPICSPALSSLRAAAQPAKTDYNYFYAPPGSGGHSTFCKTLACHNAVVNGGQAASGGAP